MRNKYFFILITFLWLFPWHTALAQTEPDPAAVAFAEAQDTPVVYLRYDVNITVLQDGRFRVQEIQQIHFKEQFRTAFAEIPATYTTAIEDIRLLEGEQAYTETPFAANTPATYTVSQENDTYFIEWAYEPTQPGDIRTFTLEYVVEGGLWVYDEGDTLEWRAVPADRGGVPAYASQVTVELPADVAPLQTNAFGPLFNVAQNGRFTTFQSTEPLLDGTAFQVLLTMPHGLTAATVQTWQIAEDTAELQYRITGLQQELEFTDAGNLLVTEQQQLTVEAGALYSGFKQWNLATMDAVADVQLFEGQQTFSLDEQGCDYCFWASEISRAPRWARANAETGDLELDISQAGSINLSWYVPPLVKGETTNFAMLYEAQGVLWITPQDQQLAWTVISGYDVPIETAEVVITLPPDVTLENARLEGGRLQLRSGGRIAILHDGPIPAGESWQIRITLPANATAAVASEWQGDVENAITSGERIRQANREAEIRRAQTQVGFATAGGFILVAGLLGVVLVWYLRGRDQTITAVPTYLTEPPSDLPPGIVAYLLDEQPTPKGALASLFHLASLGLLRLDFTYNLSLVANWHEPLTKGQQIETPTGQTVTVPEHLVTLFNGLLPALSKDHQRPTSLDTISYEFTQALPQVYYQMGQETTHFFAELPSHARHRWLSWGQWLVLTALGASACLWFTLFGDLGQVVFAPPVALAVVGGALVLVSRWMPQRTDAGAEEATKWRAFREYLKNLKTFGTEVQPTLDRYFAYAVALDVEEVVLSQAAELGGTTPIWTRPMVFARPLPLPSVENQPIQPVTTTPAVLRPISTTSPLSTETVPMDAVSTTPASLQGLSQQLTGGLESASRNLTRVLNTAAGDLGDTPFNLVIKGVTKFTWNTTSSALEVMGEILDSAASGDEGGGYGGSSGYSGGSSSSGRSSWSSSRSSGSSSRSSSSSFGGRSSSSRRSGGGGSRGFKR